MLSPTPEPTLFPPADTPVGEVATAFLTFTKTPQALQITADSVRITWATNHDSQGRIQYGTPGQKEQFVSITARLQQHSVVLSGLTPGAVVRYQVTATDTAGRTIRSTTCYFRTLPAASDVRPSVALDLPDSISGKHAVIGARTGDGTAYVCFSIDGKICFTDYIAPFIWEADTTVLSDGPHTFAATAISQTGESAAISQSSQVRNRLAAELSPVHVTITQPQESNPVTGAFILCAELSHDLGLDISQIQFWIDETQISQQTFSPPLNITPVLSPVYVVSATYNATRLDVGEHVFRIQVQDTAGNWGSDSQRFSRASRPSVTLSVRREVVQSGGSFEVTLHITNTGTVDAANVVVEDQHEQLQCVADARYSRGGSDYRPLPTAGTVGNDNLVPSNSQMTANLYLISAGQTKTLRYSVVPILRDPYDSWCEMTIGSILRISYDIDRITRRETVDLAYPISAAELLAATRASDYLVVTSYANLRTAFGTRDTHDLFAKMGELARTRNAVIGNVSAFRASWGAASVKQLIGQDGIWTAQMPDRWIREGYLLIVGETAVIPAWRVENVALSDYPYANTLCGEAPELRVGRIIGNTEQDLTVPLVSSLASAYSARSALLISGPENTWEPYVQRINRCAATLEGIGISTTIVHSEFWTYAYELYAKALRNKEAAHSRTDLIALLPFLLKRIGPDRGAASGTDLTAYTPQQLVAWLLWARNDLPSSLTREQAMAQAESIIADWEDDPTLEELVWIVLKDLIGAGEDDRLLTANELAAWLLWEETAPRGSLSSDDLGSITLGSVPEPVAGLSLPTMIAHADLIADADRMQHARLRAESIMTERPARGGSNGNWTYTYCADRLATEQARSSAIKAASAAGQDIICFNGHGDPGGWCGALTDWADSGSEIEPISFGGKNPVVIAFSCSTGYYEQEPQYRSPGIISNLNPSISEGFLRSGTAVYLGATESMFTDLSQDLVTGRFWRYFPGPGSVGDSLHALKTDTVVLGAHWFHFKYYFNLYGDPKYGQP